MEQTLMSMMYLFPLMTLANSAFKPIFGPPNVTLNCSADYVTLNKVIEMSWTPTLLSNTAFISPKEVDERIQNCEARINCSAGYTREPAGCPSVLYNEVTDSYTKWYFKEVPIHETLCSVHVSYIDFEDYNEVTLIYQASKHCSFSAPESAISMQGSAGIATVGQPYSIECSIQMSEKVDSSIVKIDWSGPNGSITDDDRINIHSTVSNDGIIHNSTLQFTYLRQNDSGSFTCGVTILDTYLSQTYQLDSFAISTPNVSITTFHNQGFHNTLLLECIITTVRGIIIVDIVWMANNKVIKRVNGSLGNVVNNSIIYRDVYNVSNVGDEGTEYHCHAVINEISVANGSFYLITPSNSGIVPSPTTRIFSTVTTLLTDSSILTDATDTAMVNPPSNAVKTVTIAGSAQAAIIISIVITLLFISLLAGVIIYKFRRFYLKRSITNVTIDDKGFKAPTISEFGYSITHKDDASICESLDTIDRVVGQIIAIQEPNIDDEQCEDDYPSNEEILNYICGQNSKCCDSRQSDDSMEYRESSKAEEWLCNSTEKSGHDIVKATHSMTYRDDSNKSVLFLDAKRFEDEDTVQQNSCNLHITHTCKGNNQNRQMAEKNTEEDPSLSAEESSKNRLYVTLNANAKSIPYIKHKISSLLQNRSHNSHHCSNTSIILPIVDEPKHDSTVQEESCYHQNSVNGTMPQAHNNVDTISIEVVANSGQLSFDSSDELTEETSVSSYGVNVSSVEGEYTENTLSSCNVLDDAVYIPMQLHSLYQNIVKQFDGKVHSPISTIESDYVDQNIAIQAKKHTAV